MNQAAAAWMMDVGKEKWPLCYSPCPRFGTLTSNNAESVNGALRKIRKLPILDCLMAIEHYVGEEVGVKHRNLVEVGLLTHHVTTKMEKVLRFNSSIRVSQHCELVFIVSENVMRGEPLIEFVVQLFESNAACTCGYPTDMGAPCIHSVACLRKAGLLRDANRYFDTS